MYKLLLKWHTKKIAPILHQDKLEEVKTKVEQTTGLRPMNERLFKNLKALNVPTRLRDHMRNMLTGKIKCGSYWSNIQDLEERAYCVACQKQASVGIIESEPHLWLECRNNGQNMAWETARNIWQKSTERPWSDISIGLIRGAPAVTFENDHTKDSERLHILISMTVWAIWKSRNKNTINNQDVAPGDLSN